MTIPLHGCRAATRRGGALGFLAAGILTFSTSAARATECDPTFAVAGPPPPTLSAAIQSRLSREGGSPRPLVVPGLEGLPARQGPAPSSLVVSGRAWPLALAAAADVGTTFWAQGRGAAEMNPLLTPGRLDVVMVKLVQFPLLTTAIDAVERRHPRLGRHLRWASLVFHAALAIHNVRMGRTAALQRLEGPRP